MDNIAIIPARSGSKGLKHKNIRTLNGKPLLAYTIEAAVESGAFDTVMVSTDSEEYAKIATEYGAEVPFLRSSKTASDNATTRECVLEVISNYKEMDKEYDRLMILQPTSPLRTAEDIIKSIELFDQKKAKSVISICEMEHSPNWCNVVSSTLSLNGFIKKQNDRRRQDLDTFYRLNGAIYLHDIEYYCNNEDIFDENCYAYIMDKKNSIDIDDEFDFKISEIMIKMRSYDGK